MSKPPIIITTGNKNINLGSRCEFNVEISDPQLEYQVFLKRENIIYLKPLTDWISLKNFQIFPEAPGKYLLWVKWRSDHGHKGHVECPFSVTIHRQLEDSP